MDQQPLQPLSAPITTNVTIHATIPSHNIQKQRQKKHKQIMTAIYNYKRSPEQIKMLDRVKQATNMEINLRFKNSMHNHSYKFPVFQDEFEQEEDCEEFPGGGVEVLYDLHSQAEVVKKSVSTKTLSLDASRRVKSLEREHVGDLEEEKQIIGKIHRRPIMPNKTHQISELVLRKNSLRDRKSRNRSNLRLPQLKKVPSSEKKNHLQQIVGKKIHTESSSPDEKRFAKYLKGAQNGVLGVGGGGGRDGRGGEQQQPKRFFLQEC